MATCDLYDIWAKACNYYDIPEDSIRSWYERIRAKLSEDETKRVYHNWSNMLAHKRPELDRAKPHIVLAAFFQYYEFELDKSCAPENCKIFKEFCRDAMVEDENMKQIVYRLLGEKTKEAITSDIDDDMAVLQDLDLLILASSPETYKNYAELSRQEWLNAGKTNYDILRLKVKSDDIPTTSRSAKTCKNSPKKNCSKIPQSPSSGNKFQKLRDDKAKKLLKRSRLMMQDKNNLKNGTKLQNKKKEKLKVIVANLKNSDRSQLVDHKHSAKKSNCDDAAASDDDCVIVEPLVPYVTIVDQGDTDNGDSDSDSDCENSSINSNSKQSNNAPESNASYQRFSKPLVCGVSSTPCNKKSQPNANPNNPSALFDNAVNQFFIDISSNSYLGNVIYNKSKETDANDTVVVVEDATLKDTTGDATLKQLTNENVSPPCDEEKENDEQSDDDDESSSEEEDSDSEDEINVKAEDDSVIFVSETNVIDFIPLEGTKANKKKKQKATSASKSISCANQHYSNLLNKNEKRELEAYNSNTYNPNAGKVFTEKKRMVIIDGSNVAFKHSANKAFSVKALTIAVEYFKKMGHEVKAVIPQYRMNFHKSTDPAELDKLHKNGFIVLTPCKNLPGLTSISYDDRFILQLASEFDAAIVSNDNYRDLINENAAFKKIIETRVIGYTWCNDLFLLPKDPYGKWGPTLDMILNRS